MHSLHYFHFIHFFFHSWPFLSQCVDPTNGKHVLVFPFLSHFLSKNTSRASLINLPRLLRPKFMSVPCWSESSSGSNKSSEYNRLEHDKNYYLVCVAITGVAGTKRRQRKERSAQPILYMSDGEITCSTYVYRKRYKGEVKECGWF